MSNATQPTRRQFLATTAGLAASSIGFPAVLKAAPDGKAKLNVAFIGVGGRGGANLKTLAGKNPDSVNVVAICDVNGRSLDQASREYPNARRYVDFRKLYDKTDEIDAVVVSTCEHTHAFATLPALQAGKHVYCEKLMANTVEGARSMVRTARETGKLLQIGHQRRSNPRFAKNSVE